MNLTQAMTAKNQKAMIEVQIVQTADVGAIAIVDAIAIAIVATAKNASQYFQKMMF